VRPTVHLNMPKHHCNLFGPPSGCTLLTTRVDECQEFMTSSVDARPRFRILFAPTLEREFCRETLRLLVNLTILQSISRSVTPIRARRSRGVCTPSLFVHGSGYRLQLQLATLSQPRATILLIYKLSLPQASHLLLGIFFSKTTKKIRFGLSLR
jgi:hypothetical protein